MPDEFITVADAQSRLGVSKAKMADLIMEGVITTTTNPLDKRSKLVRVTDVEELLASGELGRRKKEGNRYMTIRVARHQLDDNLYAEEVDKGEGGWVPAGKFVDDPETELVRYLSALGEDWHIVATFQWKPNSNRFTGARRIVEECAELLLERQED